MSRGNTVKKTKAEKTVKTETSQEFATDTTIVKEAPKETTINDSSEKSGGKNFSVFDGDPKKRPYANLNVNPNNPAISAPIPEEKFLEPDFEQLKSESNKEFEEEAEKAEDKGMKEREVEAEKHKIFNIDEVKNPALDDMKLKNKKKSAEHLADTLINAYCLLNEYGYKWCAYDEAKYQYKAVMGKFNMAVLELEMQLSDDPNDSISVKDFLVQLSDQAKEVFQVDEDWKAEVRELMVEIFVRRGWGLTPEQRLIILLFEDMMPKIQALISIKRSTAMILKQGGTIFKQLRAEEKKTLENIAKESTKQPEPTTTTANNNTSPENNTKVEDKKELIQEIEYTEAEEVPND